MHSISYQLHKIRSCAVYSPLARSDKSHVHFDLLISLKVLKQHESVRALYLFRLEEKGIVKATDHDKHENITGFSLIEPGHGF
jgi:hypothetical protein